MSCCVGVFVVGGAVFVGCGCNSLPLAVDASHRSAAGAFGGSRPPLKRGLKEADTFNTAVSSYWLIATSELEPTGDFSGGYPRGFRTNNNTPFSFRWVYLHEHQASTE